MFPPMVSASPPPSDDESSGDGEEFGVADSSFDITGLSQKLPVYQAQNHKPAALPFADPPPRLVPVRPTSPTAPRLSPEWGEIGGAVPSPVGPPAPPEPPGLAPPLCPAGESRCQDAVVSNREVASSAAVAGSGRERGVFSDSDSDSERDDRVQFQVPGRRSDVFSRNSANGAGESEEAASAKSVTAPNVSQERDGDADKVRQQTNVLQNGTGDICGVTQVDDSEDGEFGDFGSFSAATESDRFDAQCEIVTNSANSASVQTTKRESSVSPSTECGIRTVDARPPNTELEPNTAQLELPDSDLTETGVNIDQQDEFGDFVAPGDCASDSRVIETSESLERVPSADEFGGFVTAGEFPSSSAVEDSGDSGPATGTGVGADPQSAPVDSVPVPDISPNSAKLQDHSAVPVQPEEPLSAASPPPPPPDDFGDFATSNDDNFGDFSAAPDDPSADFGAFSGPADDFGGFSAPPAAGESSADALPADSYGGGGGSSASFADFGAVFAAPADPPGAGLGTGQQLADPAGLGEDEFGDFEDFQATVPPQETPADSDETAVSALLAGLFPSRPEDRDPACSPLDSGGVWYQLRQPDATAALRYRWSGCQAYTALLRALRVDASNIISFGGWGGGSGRFSLDPEPLQPVKVSPDLEVAPTEQSEPSLESAGRQPVSEVPPAAFDWTTSGLKNPLETTGLERELLSAEAPPGAAPPPAAASSSLYSRLLATRPPGPALSDAAGRVAQRIPDIDFMSARVLMFPVRGE